MPPPDETLHETTPPSRIPDLAVAALIFIGVILLLLVLRPLADVPMNDDFSWARTAEVFARTGKIVYNGWGNPILLPHTIVGALVIRLFGFSHIALGALGIVSGAALAATSYLLARACSVPRTLSLFFVALLTLNPVFLGATPTFMSDIPTAFLLVASLLAFIRALYRKEGETQFGLHAVPLGIATVLAFLAGANRQVFWPVFLLAFAITWPILTPTDRTRRLLPALLSIVIGGALLTLWFSRQPYSVPLNFNGLQFYLKNAPELAAYYPYKFLNLIGLFLLPVALPLTIMAFRRPAAAETTGRPGLALMLSLLAGVLPLIIFFVQPNSARELWNGKWGLTPYGQYASYQGVQVGGVSGYMTRPAVISTEVALLLYFLGAVGIGLTIFVLTRRAEQKSPASLTTTARNILLVGSLTQLLLPLPWYASGAVFDRYLPALLPGLFIALLIKGEAKRTEPRLYLIGVPLALLYAFGGFAFCSEYFAYTRTRASLYHELRAKGIPDEQIDAGVENCGDTQIALEGYINNPNLSTPAGAYKKERMGNCLFSPGLFPVIDAQYLLSTGTPPVDISEAHARDPLYTDPDPVTSMEYPSMLGPTRRTIYVYRVHKVGE